eukprot:7056722-Lingulodinium_polyedra.AAC.1
MLKPRRPQLRTALCQKQGRLQKSHRAQLQSDNSVALLGAMASGSWQRYISKGVWLGAVPRARATSHLEATGCAKRVLHLVTLG